MLPLLARLPRENAEYRPRPAPYFRPERIILAKGSRTEPDRARLVDAIRALFPDAEIVDAPQQPHNRVDLTGAGPLAEHYAGKRTLVFGEHRSAVRCSRERDNCCPNYWHFSPYSFCPYDCRYCYLAGTPAVRFSPAVKIFVNLPEMLDGIDRVARRQQAPTAFYLGKLQDGLALDPLSGYARTLVPFFARHPIARLIVLTKSASVDNLVDVEPAGHTVLSWSLNPPEICAQFEAGTPPVAARIEAMRRCADAGYLVRAVVMPIIPVPGWAEIYGRFLQALVESVPLQRLTLGSICIYPSARDLMERKLGGHSVISAGLGRSHQRCGDGRGRFPADERAELYAHLIRTVRLCRSDLAVSLCLEDKPLFDRLGLAGSLGRCNCVW